MKNGTEYEIKNGTEYEMKKGEENGTLSLKKKRVMIYFIEAAKKLIGEEGLHSLSIRRVAGEAGYNSATLYNYFDDMEYLTLFASVGYLRDYVGLLEKNLSEDMTALERYREIYRCFNRVAFEQPEVFHNMFFGKHAGRLGEILRIYYEELFPEELEGLDEKMREMLMLGTMRERDRVVMKDLIAEGFVDPERAEPTIDLMVGIHQHFIYEVMVRGEELDVKEHEDRFLTLFDYLLDRAR